MQQLSLFPEIATEWTSDDWQTPNREAAAIASLITPTEICIFDVGAGNGQITKFIPSDRQVYAIERNPLRAERGRQVAPHATWLCEDYLLWNEAIAFDIIVGNPPFSQALEFLERSLQLITPTGRILFLLPIDWNCGIGASTAWKKLDAHIHHEYRCKGRVSYLDRNGIKQPNRQVYDAVFDIRSGQNNAAVSYLGDVL